MAGETEEDGSERENSECRKKQLQLASAHEQQLSIAQAAAAEATKGRREAGAGL